MKDSYRKVDPDERVKKSKSHVDRWVGDYLTEDTKMKKTRRKLWLIDGKTLLVLVVLAFVSWLQVSRESAGTPEPTPLPPNAVLVSIASSDTKDEWLDHAIEQFNGEGYKTTGGATIVVAATHVRSGPSMAAILDGSSQPVVWSPGDASWVEQVNASWRRQTGRPLNSQPCPPTVYAPVGFALWRPMAEALGWPDSPVGWETIAALAADPAGWAAYGHPEWGHFRFGHSHPAESNTGLLSLTSFVYGVLGNPPSLTDDQVYAAEAALRALEQNTAKYGRSSRSLLDLMASEGPSYLHGAAIPEANVARFNIDHADELQFPLAFVIPAGGTIWADHPYCILDNAEWVTAEQAEAAAIFRDYLLSREQQEAAIDAYLRPVDPSIELRAPLDLEHGIDPRVSVETVPALPSPNAEVSAAVIDLFNLTKRKASVIVVLDISGSMRGKKIKSATEATAEFLGRLDPEDEVAVLIFNDEVFMLSELQPARVDSEALREKVVGLIADGGTALYDAVCQASQMMAQVKAADVAAGESRLYGIVLLSDGDDTKGRPTQNQMFATCLPDNPEADGFKIFPIAFGEAADRGLLQRIAAVTAGEMCAADPSSIQDCYVAISAEQ